MHVFEDLLKPYKIDVFYRIVIKKLNRMKNI